MPKFVLITLIALLTAASLVACGGGSDSKSNNEAASKSTPELTFTPVPTVQPRGGTPGTADRAEHDADPNIPGVYFKPHPGADGIAGNDDDRNHIPDGTVVPTCTADQIARDQVSNPLCYTSNPPTSGPHANSFMPNRILPSAVPKENLLHNLEHGAVVVWYNSTNQPVILELAAVVNADLSRGYQLVMSPYAGMEPETIALTSWTRLDKFPVSEYTKKRVDDFIEVNERRFNPEGF